MPTHGSKRSSQGYKRAERQLHYSGRTSLGGGVQGGRQEVRLLSQPGRRYKDGEKSGKVYICKLPPEARIGTYKIEAKYA